MPKPNALAHAFSRRGCFVAAGAALLLAALAASSTEQCGADGGACAVEDVEETALLSHSRAARVAREDRRAMSLAPAPERRATCQDDPNGWKDSEGNNCAKYVKDDWCTDTGGYGRGWWSMWGSFSRWGVSGVHAGQACCGCGGGTAVAPSGACQALEADGELSYGLSFFFQTDDQTGCTASACQPASVMARGIPKIFEAEAKGEMCSCWVAAGQEAADGSDLLPEDGQRLFLFSYNSSNAGNSCSQETCVARYAEVLSVFKLGNLAGAAAAAAENSATAQVLQTSHWTTSCTEMPDGTPHDYAQGLLPASTMVNLLMSWDAVPLAEQILSLVSIRPDPAESQALGNAIGQAAMPPITSRAVLGNLASSWQSISYTTAMWILDHLTQLLTFFTGKEETVILETSFNTDNYYPQMVQFLLAGLFGQPELKKWYLNISNGGKVGEGPGPNTTSYYGWEDVKDMLLSLGGKIADGSVVRENELGYQVLNGALWPEAPGGKRSIFLGASRESHAFVRPLLAQVLDNAQGASGETCDGSTCWSAEWLRQQARDFLANREKVEKDDLKWFNTKILHKVHLNMDITDSEAKAFSEFMDKALTIIPFPESVMDQFLIRTALNIPSVQAARTAYLEKFKPAIVAKFPDVNFDEAKLALTASGFMDSLLFAGGLSVPSALAYVLALTHQKESSKWPALQGLQLDESNLVGILWEALRLYPPVAGFPFWEKKADSNDWHHHLTNVQMALLDADIFEDPDTFKFRPMDLYTNYSIGWVDQATWPNGVTPETIAAPDSHRCPGRELSLQIMIAFLQEFVAAGPWQRKQEDISINAYSPGAFTLQKFSQSDCWVPPPECAPTFYYHFTKYTGCTTANYDKPWCAHTYFYVPFQWSECKVLQPPCDPEPEAPDAGVTQTERSALDALMECSVPEWTPEKRATCVCTHANDENDVTSRAERCTGLSALAADVGAPWECAVSRVQGEQVCTAYAPWWKRISQAVTRAWNTVKRWGLSLVPTSRCYPTNLQPCSQFVLATKSAQCSEVSAQTLSDDWLDLPKQLQGVFWLTEQGDSSALVSFGRTSDGAGISPGRLGSDGRYKVRVPGDRSWSFATTDGGTFAFSEAIDLVYEFLFDNAEDPNSAQIIPTARKLLGISVPPWLLNFNMTLVPGGNPKYPGSVIWQRESDILNIIKISAGIYQIVQVIDGDGNRLPAYDHFQSFCDDPTKSGTSSPGKIWYHAYEMKPYTVTSVEEELATCPSFLGVLVPKTITAAFMLVTKLGGLDIHSFINDPPLDPAVYDEFTILNSLAVIHGALIPFGGANDPPEDRICTPNKTQPLDKLLEYGSLSPREDTDLRESQCDSQPFSRFNPLVLCGFLILTELPFKDGLGNNSGNTWETALAGSPPGTTKEEYLLSFFDPYKNQDGDPIYPPQEFDWKKAFQRSPGVWENACDENYALDVFGTFRVRQVEGTPPSHGGETAALVLKLDALSGFARRPGFAAWGGNMYFTAEGMLLGIERNTLSGSPEWVWADAPAAEWQYAKWAFRSTLMNSVTLIDHLWFMHLSVANPMATATREALLPKHPLRRLLSAATLGTIDVNAEATHVLVGPNQVLHRASPFEDWGEVHSAAEDNIFPFEVYFGPFLDNALLDKLPPRIKTAPLYADGPLLMNVISDMIEGYFGTLGTDWCEAGSGQIVDQGIQDYANHMEAWFRSERPDRALANLEWLKGDAEADWTCEAVKKLLKCQLFGVSGFHQHVGKVADYVRNPEFIGISWAPGELSARPQQAMLYAQVSAATGFMGIPLDQNFEFIVDGIEKADALKQVLAKYQTDLKAIEPIIEHRNLARTVPYNRMNPAYAEISLYQ